MASSEPTYRPRKPIRSVGSGRLYDHLRGDGPCSDCGTLDNIIWFTESAFWNEVVRPNGEHDKILCIPCFVERVDAAGLKPTGWELKPEFHWETSSEMSSRKSRNSTASRNPDWEAL